MLNIYMKFLKFHMKLLKKRSIMVYTNEEREEFYEQGL